jgi:hypothetical protein
MSLARALTGRVYPHRQAHLKCQIFTDRAWAKWVQHLTLVLVYLIQQHRLVVVVVVVVVVVAGAGYRKSFLTKVPPVGRVKVD